MSIPMVVVIAAAGIGMLLAVRFTGTWLRFGGARLITCPENLEPAGVRVDARHAAATGLVLSPDLRLDSCSHWPEKADCAQECLREILSAPADCLVRNIL